MENYIEGRTAFFTVTLLLVILAFSYGTYFHDPGQESSGPEVKGIEEGQSYDGAVLSEFYMVELGNGSKYHYWNVPASETDCAENCEARIDPGYAEIRSDLSLFRERGEKSKGLDYLPEENVCARGITSTSIEIYSC
jgi:hypothetical protein